MRILVCGGRMYGRSTQERDFLRSCLSGLIAAHGRSLQIIEGGASGADYEAKLWAQMHQIPCTSFPADWDRHGFRAGPIRNQRMIDEGKPDMVVAFPGGAGTADMVRRAEAAKIPVRRVG